MSRLEYNQQSKTKVVFGRNEGKLKSFESCCDVRAWSHDCRIRAHYLREWIKCDMPVCLIPVCTLLTLFKAMTCKSRARIVPGCHPNCKSKNLLDSINASCHVMKQCLENDEKFNQYFQEEELETTHWPCIACLEALKTIKMFWKAIIEKILNINITKTEDYRNVKINKDDCIRNLAKSWHNDIVEQATYVKSSSNPLRRTQSHVKNDLRIIHEEKCQSLPDSIENSRHTSTRHKRSKRTSTDYRDLELIRGGNNVVSRKRSYKLLKVHTTDTGCDPCTCNEDNEEDINKVTSAFLQQRFIMQEEEIAKLRKENVALKAELQDTYKSDLWDSIFCGCASANKSMIPMICEGNVNDNDNDEAKNIDSEMIITMKNCKNDLTSNFKHVSILQVLHKTNASGLNINRDRACNRSQDPINILTKVHDTFGTIVERELSIANEKKQRRNACVINGSYHRIDSKCICPSTDKISDD